MFGEENKESKDVCKYLNTWESDFKVSWEGKEGKEKRKVKMFSIIQIYGKVILRLLWEEKTRKGK